MLEGSVGAARGGPGAQGGAGAAPALHPYALGIPLRPLWGRGWSTPGLGGEEKLWMSTALGTSSPGSNIDLWPLPALPLQCCKAG